MWRGAQRADHIRHFAAQTILIGELNRVDISTRTTSLQHLGLPNDARIRLTRLDPIGRFAMMNCGEPVVLRRLTGHAFFAAGDRLPDVLIAVQDVAALIDVASFDPKNRGAMPPNEVEELAAQLSANEVTVFRVTAGTDLAVCLEQPA